MLGLLGYHLEEKNYNTAAAKDICRRTLKTYTSKYCIYGNKEQQQIYVNVESLTQRMGPQYIFKAI